jgi:hypothetical protein
MLTYTISRNVPGLSPHAEVRDEETDEDNDTNDIAHLLRKAREACEAHEDEDAVNPEDDHDPQVCPAALRSRDADRHRPRRSMT